MSNSSTRMRSRLHGSRLDSDRQAVVYSDVLTNAIERTHYYPERAMADKIYRNRENLSPMQTSRHTVMRSFV